MRAPIDAALPQDHVANSERESQHRGLEHRAVVDEHRNAHRHADRQCRERRRETELSQQQEEQHDRGKTGDE
jgi:hypothetical protein